jgi:hypothetical protein
MPPQVGFEITANNEGLLAVLQQSADAIKSAAAQASGAFAPVTAAFETLKGAAAGVAAIFAGGAGFKEALDTTASLARESMALGIQLGVSATRASDLRVAIAEVGVTQDQLSAAGLRVTRTLVTNEDAFKRLGVATRDQSGNYRSTIDIIMDTNQALAQLQEGTDRNTEAQRIYGRGWMEVMPTLRLTAAVMEEAKQRAQDLGLEVGQEQIANFKQYRASMAGVQDVFRGLMNTVGEALMPSLTALGNWFGSTGPSLITVFRFAVSGIALAFEGIMLPISLVFDTIKSGIQVLVVSFASLADVIDRSLHGDWAGVKAAWKAGSDQIDQINKDWLNKMVSDAQEAHDRMAAILAGHVATPQAEPQGDKAEKPPEKESRVPQWQEELTQQQAAHAQELGEQGDFHEVSKADEVAYWQSILATNETSSKEKIAINNKIGALTLSMEREVYQGQLAALKEQEAAYKNNLDAKLVIAKEYAEKVGESEGFESKAYADAAKEIVTIEREKVAQLNEIDATRRGVQDEMALAEIDRAEKIAQLNESLHIGSEQRLLEQEKGFENQRYQIKLDALEKTLALEKLDPDKNEVAIAKTFAQIEALYRQHSATLLGIDTKQVQQQKQDWKNLFDTIQNDFASNISKMLEGTETFAQGIRNLFMQIGDAVVQTLVKIAVQWLATQIENRIAGQTTAEAQIAASAGEAGAAGVASFAGAPWPVDIGAPAFGAAMAASAEAFSLSAQGLDLPPGMAPPRVQLHPEETVLPADIAKTYREHAPGSGGRTGDMHVHIQAIDTKSVHEMFRNNKSALAKAVREHARKRR